MNLWDIAIKFGLIHEQKIHVYCQWCGEDITKEGGRVTDKSSYCQDAECIAGYIIQTGNGRCGDFYSPRKLQRAIMEKKLVHYRPVIKI